MKNKFFIGIFIFIVLVFGSIFYINRVFIPIHFKQIVLSKAKEHLNRTVTVDKLHFSLFSGLSATKLKIFQKDSTENVLLEFDQATIGINLLSVFLQKKILIPSMELTNPVIHVQRNQNGIWNFQDLLPDKNSNTSENNVSNDPTNSFDLKEIIIERLVLENGIILFKDNAITPNIDEKIVVNSLRSSLSFHRGAVFVADIRLPNITSLIKIDGSYSPFSQRGNLKLFTENLPLDRYAPYINNNNLTVTSGKIQSLNIETSIDGNAIEATGKGIINDFNISQQTNKLSGSIEFSNVELKWDNGLNNLKGQLTWTNAAGDFLDEYSFDGTLKTTIISSGFNDQYQFFKGSLNIKDAIVTAKKIGSFRGDLNSKDMSLDIKENNISFLGDLRMDNADLKTTSGTIKTRSTIITNLDYQQNKNDTIIQSDIEITQANINVDDKSFQGDFAWTNGKAVIDHQQNINASGNILMRQGLIQIDENRIIKGNLTLTGMDATLKHFSDLSMNASSLHFINSDITHDSHHLQGDIKLVDLSAETSDQKINIKTSGVIEQANINIDDQKSVKGFLQFNNLTLNTDNKKITINTDASLLNSTLVLSEKQHFAGDIRAEQTHLTLNSPHITLKSNLVLSNTKAQYDEFLFNGDASLTINYTGNTPQLLDGKYTGKLNLKNANLSGIPQIGSLSQINGTFDLTKDKLTIDKLNMNALGIPISTNGKIIDFKSPIANLNVTTETIDLIKIKPFIDPYIQKHNISNLHGKTSIKAAFNGDLAKPLSGNIDALVTLDNMGLYINQLETELSSLSGEIRVKNDELLFQSVQGLFDNKKLLLEGNIADFDQPVINISLNIDGITNAVLKGATIDDTFKINSFNVKAYQSHLNANGSVLLQKGQPPYLNLAMQANVDTEDIIKIMPKLKESVEPLNLKGSLTATSTVKGYANNWTMLESNTNINTPYLSVSGYKANNIIAKVSQAKGKINSLDLSATIYDGAIESYSSVDLTKTDYPFDSSVKLNRIDIAKFIKDFPSLRTNDIAGWFSGQASLEGTVSNPVESLTGNGSFDITEGFLREIKVFKGLFSIFNHVIQMDQDIVITEAKGNFQIKNQRLTINNGILRGSTMGFEANGWVGFDKSIGITIDPNINLVKISGDSLQEALPINATLPSVKVSGTISEPKYDYDISAGKIIQKTLKNTVGTLIDGLLN